MIPNLYLLPCLVQFITNTRLISTIIYLMAQWDKYLKTEKAKTEILIPSLFKLHVHWSLSFIKDNITSNCSRERQHWAVMPEMIVFLLILLFSQLNTLKFISSENPIYITSKHIWTLPMSIHMFYYHPNKSYWQLSLGFL